MTTHIHTSLHDSMFHTRERGWLESHSICLYVLGEKGVSGDGSSEQTGMGKNDVND